MLYSVVINLDHREDRLMQFTESMDSFSGLYGHVHRLPAIKDTLLPALGCLKSHIAALTNFLCYSEESFVAIFEDDFRFKGNPEIIQPWLDDASWWDAILLTGTLVTRYDKVIDNVSKVLQAQSAAGYIVRRDYVPKLIYCLSKYLPVFEELKKVEDTAKRDLYSFGCNDQSWKELQRIDRWYIANPLIGHQVESFSDIAGTTANYTAREELQKIISNS